MCSRTSLPDRLPPADIVVLSWWLPVTGCAAVITIARFAPTTTAGEVAVSTSMIAFGFGPSLFTLVRVLRV